MQKLKNDSTESLAIIYTFYPYIDTSGIVFAKRINQDIKENVTIITNKFVSNARLDHSLEVLIKPYVKETIEIQSPFTYREWKHFESFIDGAFSAYLENIEKGKNYTTVYSRSMSVVTHLVAYKIKKHNPDIKWVAEFSDPVVKDLDGKDKFIDVPVKWLSDNHMIKELEDFNSNTNLFLLSELLVYLKADEIWYTNDLQKKVMLSYLQSYIFNENKFLKMKSRIENIIKIKPQPTLPPKFYEISNLELGLDTNYINIGYFGNFNANRDFNEFFKSWLRLSNNNKKRIRLHIFSNISEDKIRKDIPLELLDYVCVEKSLNYLDYLKVLNQFDYVVSIDTKVSEVFGCNPFLPSKISDYLGANSRVLALVEKGSPVDALKIDKITKQYFGHVNLSILF